MKFKVGDKVIPKVFSFENDGIIFNINMNKYVGKQQVITGVRVFGVKNINLYQIDNDFEWVEGALELVEPQEYFYVGQTVYSPLFRNKERKSKVVQICTSTKQPVLCEGGYYFYLDGKRKEEDDFVSLFQEPIQFPVNKPIERFEEGEIVEVSNNGEFWKLCRYIGNSETKELPYKVYVVKDDRELQHSVENYAKIRKIK